MKKRMSQVLVLVLALLLLAMPAAASANGSAGSGDVTPELELVVIDDGVEPMLAPVIIGIAVRALISLGRTELARYLADNGARAYCNRYGSSGPQLVSNMICN
ncbi:hypothetical protein [Evansella clarkii]|uniref:hypothetical protein n=1 Tax=Evansella clarkii TaxID=79879 RepID=UPI0009976A08|nr:hypothetical protein [Evansella clarkii]